MSIFGKKKDVDFKARLERKLYLARADPEPVFDLSECDLKAVPSGIYSLCKVFQKEHLFLQCNQLSRLQDGGSIYDLALLVTLDLHSNKFTTLPQDFRYLKNLRELNVSHNLIKELPDVLCELSSLRSLDVSHNKLKRLPSSVGNLKGLQVFKVQNNQLSKLPNSLGKLKGYLQLFSVDVENIDYPPKSVCLDGPIAILKYLAKANELLNRDENNECTIGDDVTFPSQEYYVQGDKQDDYIQEERLKERMAIEKELQELKDKEFELQKRNKEEKNKLLEDILVQESSLYNKLLEFQIQKDAEKLKLIESLQKVEDESDRLLEKFLEASQALKNPALLQEIDRLQREEMLSLETQQLRRKEVLEAMDRLLAEELEHNEKLMNYKHARDSSFRDNLSRIEEMEQNLAKTVNVDKNVRTSSSKWLSELNNSLGKQGMALGILLEKTDVQSQALLSEVKLVQQQLATLTSAELQRKQLNTDERLNELAYRRVALSELLLDLVNQQDERRNQLLKTLRDVQHEKMVQDEVDDDFWLQQYQRLMDQCPESLLYAQRSLDPLLVHFLVEANATHCLPYLASCSVSHISEESLRELNVCEDDIPAIMYAVKMYKEEKSRHFAPSAPVLNDQPGPSAPPKELVYNEISEEREDSEYNLCIICMSKQYHVVFIPCGHLCVCMSCAIQVRDCPLCRGSISQKINVIVP